MEKLDEKGLEGLFRAHYTGLCRFAVGFVKEEETAREIVQETFVHLWEKRHTIDPARPVKSYLATAVRNRCLNHLRDTKKFSPGLLELEENALSGAIHQPDRWSEQELHKRIVEAVEELPDKCREIFRLSRDQNLRYQEIAERLEISVKTVETQMSKASGTSASGSPTTSLSSCLPPPPSSLSPFRCLAISQFFSSPSQGNRAFRCTMNGNPI